MILLRLTNGRAVGVTAPIKAKRGGGRFGKGAKPAPAAAATAASGSPTPTAPPAAPPLLDLQDGMAAGRYTSRQLVELYLRRIEALARPMWSPATALRAHAAISGASR